jgi:hypothetical protein
MANKKTAKKKKSTKTAKAKTGSAWARKPTIQLTARVTEAFKKKTKSYAKANGLKLNTLFVKSLDAFMETPANA